MNMNDVYGETAKGAPVPNGLYFHNLGHLLSPFPLEARSRLALILLKEALKTWPDLKGSRAKIMGLLLLEPQD